MPVSLTPKLMLIFLLTVSGCWKHQQHEVTAPATPVYQLSGTISDFNSGRSLANIEILCEVHRLSFQWELATENTFTDSTGHFEFTLCPGEYVLHFKREGFPLREERIMMPFENRQFDYQLPAIISTPKRWLAPNTHGLDWLAASAMARVSIDSASNSYRVFFGNFVNGFFPLGLNNVTDKNPPLSGLIWANNFFWSSGGTFSQPKIFQINASTGLVAEELPAPHRLRDLTWDGTNIWAIGSNDSVYYFNETGTEILKTFAGPDAYLSGIAFSGENFWAYSKKQKALFCAKETWTTWKIYCLFYKDETDSIIHLENISYLTAGSDKMLWGVENDWIYEFILPNE